MFLKLILAAILTIPGYVSAYIDPKADQVNFSSLPVRPLNAKDPLYDDMKNSSDWNLRFTNHKVTNAVFFYLSPDKKNLLNTPASPQVVVDINYETYDETTGKFVKQTLKGLTLNLTLGNGKVVDKAAFTWEGGHNVEVRVVTFTPGNTVLNPGLILETTMEVERYYKLDPDFYKINATRLRHDATPNAANNLVVSWDELKGAESYELEWTYIDDINRTGDRETSLNKIAPDVNTFKYNSTRVVITKGTSYEIPLAYEEGQIVYRIRASGKMQNDDSEWIGVFTNWSCADDYTNLSQFPHKFSFAGHRRTMNWQYSSSFAEEGKNKVTMSYFDGTLRNRQSLTRMNTDNKTIIGETVYDHQGRAAIQILPVPVKSEALDFVPGFNKALSDKTTFDKKHFDKDNASNNCELAVGELSPESGAAKYYSESNDFINGDPVNPNSVIHRDYIPHAEGYPFTHAVYESDNTGRISAQSNPGKTFQINSGHEIKYLYSKPKTGELERFFGTEVGEAINYQKKAVIDGNGQVNVSYLDADEKVIATALAGNKPANLETAGGVDKTTKFTLVDAYSTYNFGVSPDPNKSANPSNKLGSNKYSLRYDEPYMVTTSGLHKFAYTAKIQSLTENCSPGGVNKSYCYDCVLDLDLSLKDKCGKEKFPVLPKKFGSGGETCNSTGTIDLAAQLANGVNLTIGNYQLTKVLSVNQAALEKHLVNYMDSTRCISKFSSFYIEQKQRVDEVSDCKLDCDKCKARINNYSDLTDEEKVELIDRYCAPFCSDESQVCKIALASMKADFYPEGQYGRVIENANSPAGGTNTINVVNQNGQSTINVSTQGFPSIDTAGFPDQSGGGPVINPAIYKMSIFNDNNELPMKNGVRPTWRVPEGGDYRIKGNIVYAEIRLNDKGENVPAVKNAILVTTNCPANSGMARCTPLTNLSDVKDFLNYWDDSFADALVKYHPEYCYLSFCNANKPSNDFDHQFINTRTFKDANNLGYLNLTQLSDNLLEKDPYFSGTPSKAGKFWKDQMKKRIDHYVDNTTNGSGGTTNLNMWQFANWITKCPGSGGTCPYDNTCLSLTGSENDDLKDKIWVAFRNFYNSEKQIIVNEGANRYAADPATACYSGCIGTNSFDGKLLNKPYTDWQPGIWCGNVPDGTQNCGYSNIWKAIIGKKSCKDNYAFVCNNVSIPIPSTQYYNPAQTCNIGNKDRLAKHTRRMYYNPTPNTGGAHEQKCMVPLFDPTDPNFLGTPEFAEVACPIQSESYFNEIRNEADRQYYEECGVCPLARRLELLMDGLLQAKKLNTSGVCEQLSCSNNKGNFPQLTPELLKVLNNNDGTELYWTSSLTTSKKISGTFRSKVCSQTTAQSCTFSLEIGAADNVSWTDFVKICCINYTPSPTGANVYDFTMEGHVKNTAPNAFYLTKKVTLKGTIGGCFPIFPCVVPPRCKPSVTVAQIREFANKLLYVEAADPSKNLPGKPNHLTTTSAVKQAGHEADGKISPLSIYYEYELRDLLGKNAKDVDGVFTTPLGDILWSSSITGTTLTGNLLNSANQALLGTITLSVNGYNASNIIRVMNVRPDFTDVQSCTNGLGCQTTKFIADVMVKDATGVYLNVTMNGSISNLGVTGQCIPVKVLSGSSTTSLKY